MDLAGFAQPEAFAVEGDDVAVVEEAVEDRGGGRCVRQELGPALEVDVGGDRHEALFVGSGDEPEEVIGGDAVQRREPQVVDDDEVVAAGAARWFPDGVVGQAAVERFDQLVGLEEPDFVAGGDREVPERFDEVALAAAGRVGVELLMLLILCRGGCGLSRRRASCVTSSLRCGGGRLMGARPP